MKTGEEIRTEQNPFFREIWAMGYDLIYEDDIGEILTLCRKGDRYQKTIPKRDYYWDLTMCRGILPSGSIHTWISEADGSASKFRELIKPEYPYPKPSPEMPELFESKEPKV